MSAAVRWCWTALHTLSLLPFRDGSGVLPNTLGLLEDVVQLGVPLLSLEGRPAGQIGGLPRPGLKAVLVPGLSSVQVAIGWIHQGSCVVPCRNEFQNSSEWVAIGCDRLREMEHVTRLAKFKAPDVVDTVESRPETSTGKIQKYVLREQVWAGR